MLLLGFESAAAAAAAAAPAAAAATAPKKLIAGVVRLTLQDSFVCRRLHKL